MRFDRLDQRGAGSLASMAGVDDKPGQPRCQIMRRFQFVADQQAGAYRHIVHTGNQSLFEAVAGQQVAEPCRILFQRPSRALEEGGNPQSRDDFDVMPAHGFDRWLHSSLHAICELRSIGKSKTAGLSPGGCRSWPYAAADQ